MNDGLEESGPAAAASSAGVGTRGGPGVLPLVQLPLHLRR